MSPVTHMQQNLLEMKSPVTHKTTKLAWNEFIWNPQTTKLPTNEVPYKQQKLPEMKSRETDKNKKTYKKSSPHKAKLFTLIHTRTLQRNQTALSGHLKYENSFQQAHYNTMAVASVKSAKTIMKNPVLNGAMGLNS